MKNKKEHGFILPANVRMFDKIRKQYIVAGYDLSFTFRLLVSALRRVLIETARTVRDVRWCDIWETCKRNYTCATQ